MDIMVILFAHWVSDFVAQSDYVALNKSNNKWVLAWHSFAYTILMTLFLLPLYYSNELDFFIRAMILLFASHFIIDGISSKLNSWLWENDKRHWFFVSIGFDQMLHYMILLWII